MSWPTQHKYHSRLTVLQGRVKRAFLGPESQIEIAARLNKTTPAINSVVRKLLPKLHYPTRVAFMAAEIEKLTNIVNRLPHKSECTWHEIGECTCSK